MKLPGALQGISREGQLVYTLDQVLDASSNPTGGNVLSVLAYDGVSAHRVDSLPLDLYWSVPIQVFGEDVFVGRVEVQPNNVTTGRLETWRLDANGKWQRRGSVTLPAPVQQLTQRDRLLVIVSQGIQLFDASDPAALKEVGRSPGTMCWWGDILKGDGDVTRGFWVPLGDYGVNLVPVAL